jgi:Ca2+-binding EF-hand superfamily protein
LRLDAHFFARWDPDSDGRIAMTDLPPRLQALLAPADANHDGYLTRDEMWRARAAWKAKLKALADANGDGTVTPDERKAALPKLLEAEFVRLDANHDGALTANEVADKRWARLVNADTNGDRRVTLQEFVAFRTRIAAHQSRQR